MNRLIKSTALGLSVLMGCSLCACGATDSSLGQKGGNEARRNIIRFALPSVMKKWENLFITLASQDE